MNINRHYGFHKRSSHEDQTQKVLFATDMLIILLIFTNQHVWLQPDHFKIGGSSSVMYIPRDKYTHLTWRSACTRLFQGLLLHLGVPIQRQCTWSLFSLHKTFTLAFWREQNFAICFKCKFKYYIIQNQILTDLTFTICSICKI